MLTIDVINLLKQLLQRSALHSQAFDQYQTEFLKKLQNSATSTTTNALAKECLEKLQETETSIKDHFSDGRLLVSQSQLQLQKIQELPESISQKIQESQEIPLPYSIIDHHSELAEIIKIYQRVTNHFNRQSHSSVSQETAPDLINAFNDELLRIIPLLDMDEVSLKKIKMIHQRMIKTNDLLKLPEACIAIIEVIIESTREERRSSRHFLYTIHDNLAKVNLDFSSNIKEVDNLFDEQSQCIQNFHKKAHRLVDKTQLHTDFSALQTDVIAYIESIENFAQTCKKDEQEQVIQKFQGMAREIKELQNKTKNYQNTLKDQQKQLQTDFLTKVPNRAAWNERLQIEYNRFTRYRNALSLAIVDVDKFKKINDTFGHVAGDKVISIIAQILQKSLRNTDFIARYGGDEFVILFPETTQEQARQILKKMCKKIKSIPFKFKKDDIRITISVGCTGFTEEDSMEDAFDRADRALFSAKEHGRNKIINFEN